MADNCAIFNAADIIGKRWTILIILELHKGDIRWKRYSEIKRQITDITPKMLSARLKELEDEGIIKKNIDSSQFPVKCEYRLTKAGEDFIEITKSIKQWSLKWSGKSKHCKETDCSECML